MDASRAKYRFGLPSRIVPEAFGQPGQRTFRLFLESGAATASMWLEKEQLSELALYFQEISDSLSDDAKATEASSPEPEWSGGVTSLDFKVGRLALGHDSSSNCFLLVTHEIEAVDENEAILSFWVTLRQGADLAEEALKVCAAGRPRCFLCGQPINPDGHNCPRANGHAVLQD